MRNLKSQKRALKELSILLESLPRLDCRGRCQQSCGPIAEAMTNLEHAVAAEASHGVTLPIVQGAHDTCPYLEQEGTCGIHRYRPLICRLWGMVDDPLMRCPWGCKPARWLSSEEARRIFQKMAAISFRFFGVESHTYDEARVCPPAGGSVEQLSQ